MGKMIVLELFIYACADAWVYIFTVVYFIVVYFFLFVSETAICLARFIHHLVVYVRNSWLQAGIQPSIHLDKMLTKRASQGFQQSHWTVDEQTVCGPKSSSYYVLRVFCALSKSL